jgi:hypothetical protein
MGLDPHASQTWDNYLLALQTSHIRIIDREDELIWQNASHGQYTPKLGYIQLNLELYHRESKWWWKGLWKIMCPLKAKIFMWCALNSKAQTWDPNE